MKFFAKILTPAAVFILMLTYAAPAYAQFTLLPYTEKSGDKCNQLMNDNSGKDVSAIMKDDKAGQDFLACGIKTGRITLAMVPYFIKYITNFILGLVGLVATLFIIIGGYHYVFGGLTDDKEKGKSSIRHALMGLALALMAWTIVNVIIQAVTG